MCVCANAAYIYILGTPIDSHRHPVLWGVGHARIMRPRRARPRRVEALDAAAAHRAVRQPRKDSSQGYGDTRRAIFVALTSVSYVKVGGRIPVDFRPPACRPGPLAGWGSQRGDSGEVTRPDALDSHHPFVTCPDL